MDHPILEKALVAAGGKARTRKGRPTKYTSAMGRALCKHLATGMTLIKVCERENMPRESTVRKWASDAQHPFSALYARAREIGYSRLADQIVTIADGSEGGSIADIASARLRVDTRKWMLAKMLPKVYGDKIEQTHKMDAGEAFITLLRDHVSPQRPKPALHVVPGGKRS